MNRPAPLPIEIDIPAAHGGEIDLAAFFTELIYSEDGGFSGPLLEAFDLEVSNSRAEIDDVEIDEVNIDENGDVEIQYTFTWSAFFGCDDISKTDQESRFVAGVKNGGKWVFEPHLRSGSRSALDEF